MAEKRNFAFERLTVGELIAFISGLPLDTPVAFGIEGVQHWMTPEFPDSWWCGRSGFIGVFPGVPSSDDEGCVINPNSHHKGHRTPVDTLFITYDDQ